MKKRKNKLLSNTPAVLERPVRLRKRTIEKICQELNLRKNDTARPKLFEEAIVRAFNFLGFETKRIGGPGKPDVLARAILRKSGYTVIIDGKTVSKGKILREQRINWAALQEHKQSHKANYVIVIAEKFAGGRLPDRAKRYGVSLIRNETLKKMVRIHGRTPLTLTDIEMVFKIPGYFGDRVNYCKIRSSDEEKRMYLLAMIIHALHEQNRQLISYHSEEFDTSGLTVYLNIEKKVGCKQKEVEECLSFFKSSPMKCIEIEDDGKIVLVVNPRTVIEKMRTLIDHFNHQMNDAE
jgi:hypothetical protein